MTAFLPFLLCCIHANRPPIRNSESCPTPELTARGPRAEHDGSGGLASRRFPVFSRQLRCCLPDRLVSLQPTGFLNRRLLCLAVSASSVPQTGRSERGSRKSPLLLGIVTLLGQLYVWNNNHIYLQENVKFLHHHYSHCLSCFGRSRVCWL